MSEDFSISIDRQAGKWAVFKGFDTVGKFTAYTDEAAALSAAREVVKAKGGDPDKCEVVYPRVNTIRMCLRRRTR